MKEFFGKASNPLLFNVLLFLFLLFSLIHLVICFLELNKARRITKCLPLASLSAALFVYDLGLILPALAFLFSMIGDLFMLSNNKKLGMGIGGVSFFIAHLLGVTYLLIGMNFGWAASIVGVLLFYTLCFVIGGGVAAKITKIAYFRIAGVLYFGTILLLLTCFVVAGFRISPFYFFGALGMLIFLTSDSLIVIHAKIRKIPKRHFTVMVTYLLAQALLAISYLIVFAS